jgi:hypothetical protein
MIPGALDRIEPTRLAAVKAFIALPVKTMFFFRMSQSSSTKAAVDKFFE